MYLYKKLYCKSQMLLYYSLKKYGFESHHVEVLQSGIKSQKELNELEFFYCDTYNSLAPFGLNLKAGGGQHGVYSDIVKLSISKARSTPQAKKQMAERNKIMASDDKWLTAIRKLGKANKESLVFRQKVAESNRKLVKTSEWKKAHADGIKKRSHNIGWKNKISISRSGKRVEQVDKLTGNIIRSFCGISEAERETGIKRQHICCCLKGRRKTCGGYVWRYEI